MAKAKFRVQINFDKAREATFIIDRKTGLVHVRPLRRRRDYIMPLSAVAEWVMCKVIMAEVKEKKKQKKLRVKRGTL